MPLKSDTLKLSSTLAQYLYQNKELILSGIGKFTMESVPEPIEPVEKSAKNEIVAHIDFHYDSSVKEDESLVTYISAQTGKMKSLASSDLYSYLELAKQFLNIGKPFLIEGVGTLTKNKSGKLDFSQGNLINENLSAESDQTSSTGESFPDYEEMLAPKKATVPVSRKVILFLPIITGISLAIWGGYFIYKKTNTSVKKPMIETPTQIVSDSNQFLQKDSNIIQSNAPASTDSIFKFVIEIADKNRAFQRFTDLKSYGLDILMETTDSISFKLFFKLPVSVNDTARIRDSLNIWYGTRSRTIIE